MSRKVRLSTTVTYYTQFLLLHCRLHIVLTSLKFKVITFSQFGAVEHAPKFFFVKSVSFMIHG